MAIQVIDDGVMISERSPLEYLKIRREVAERAANTSDVVRIMKDIDRLVGYQAFVVVDGLETT